MANPHSTDSIPATQIDAFLLGGVFAIARQYVDLRLQCKDDEARALYEKHTCVMTEAGQAVFDSIISQTMNNVEVA